SRHSGCWAYCSAFSSFAKGPLLAIWPGRCVQVDTCVHPNDESPMVGRSRRELLAGCNRASECRMDCAATDFDFSFDKITCLPAELPFGIRPPLGRREPAAM